MPKFYNKGGLLYSIIGNYCPRCHKGKFWPKNNPYKNICISNNGDIGCCKNCNLKYEIEPGFWYGAMYVSYALTVFISVLVWLITNFFIYDIFIQIIIISFSLIFLCPIVYFLSRLIWINIFISYKNSSD
jgi:hypothetical protein